MSFVNTALEVIRLSSEQPTVAEPSRGESSGEIYAPMNTSGGHDSAEDYLKTLPEDVVMKLQTLMYVGKDKHLNIPKVHEGLKALTHDKAEAIRAMTSKDPWPNTWEKASR
jgi:hypothetical protein